MSPPNFFLCLQKWQSCTALLPAAARRVRTAGHAHGDGFLGAGAGAGRRAPARAAVHGRGRTCERTLRAARRTRKQRALMQPRRRGRGPGRPRTGATGRDDRDARSGDETPKRTPNRILAACRSAAKRPQLSNVGGDPSKSWPLGLAHRVGNVARGSAQLSGPTPRSGGLQGLQGRRFAALGDSQWWGWVYV